MIAVIDYGTGNPGSIANMLKAIGEKNIITSDAEKICSADKLILPGVGSFDTGMKNLNESGLADVIKNEVMQAHKPVLGICLGMQLLGRRSEEGVLDGFGFIPFDNKRFRFEKHSGLKIPHMGWDVAAFCRESPLTDGLEGQQRYYFVHSYHAVCDSPDNSLMTCDYGYHFTAAVIRDNIYGVQFHPEKSHDFGMALLENFAKKC